jgi:N6-L-threonylcarbamoyladenine synthase
MRILSIETSCDETACAIIEMRDGMPILLANVVSSQIEAHAKFGGVVPQLAARMHIENIIPVLDETLAKANLTQDDINLIAVTQGPGLIPALLIGVSAAKTLSLIWKRPLIGIHHIEGHIYANFLEKNIAISNTKYQISNENSQIPNSKLKSRFQILDSRFPLIALVVSGGHTQLVLMRDHFQYEILGETEDDAVGEAFDKVARMLGLPYPGGPAVSRKADAFRERNDELQISNFDSNQNSQTPKLKIRNSKFSFPRPMINSDNYNFSFSGLKTSVLYFLKKNEVRMKDEHFIDEVCHEFQEAVVDVLVEKSKRAIEEFHPKTFVIAGGVSANIRLRDRLQAMIHEINTTKNSGSTPVETGVEPLFEPIPIRFAMPKFAYSLDNAAMIGAAAGFRYERMNEEQRKSLNDNWRTLEASASLKLSNL